MESYNKCVALCFLILSRKLTKSNLGTTTMVIYNYMSAKQGENSPSSSCHVPRKTGRNVAKHFNQGSASTTYRNGSYVDDETVNVLHRLSVLRIFLVKVELTIKGQNCDVLVRPASWHEKGCLPAKATSPGRTRLFSHGTLLSFIVHQVAI